MGLSDRKVFWVIPTLVMLVVSCFVVVINTLAIPYPPPWELLEAVGQDEILGLRSSAWQTVRDDYVDQHPACEVCGTTSELNVHHILPFHMYPTLELDPSNLITLCRTHHYRVGHDPDGTGPLRPNWKSFNPDVWDDAKRIKAALDK